MGAPGLALLPVSDLTRELLAVVLGTLGAARAVRLVTADTWPPVVWLRGRWLTWCANHAPDWADLLDCPWCFAPYAVGADLALWWLLDGAHGSATDASNWGTWWWLINLWAAASYAASMIVVRDEPPPVED